MIAYRHNLGLFGNLLLLASMCHPSFLLASDSNPVLLHVVEQLILKLNQAPTVEIDQLVGINSK